MTDADKVRAIVQDMLADDIRQMVNDTMVDWGWATMDGDGVLELTPVGIRQLLGEGEHAGGG